MNDKKRCFVFGSNLAGIHGAGAAKVARLHHRAALGVGVGPTGNAYAIPTKDKDVKRVLELNEIKPFVGAFIAYAHANPDTTFHVTQIGCGLAGYVAKDIAPLFQRAPFNCQFSTGWREWLPAHEYWTSL